MISCKDKMEPVAMESCCSPQDTAQNAAQAMHKTSCGCAPMVEDRQSRRLVGVVTERDVGTARQVVTGGPQTFQSRRLCAPRLSAAGSMSQLKKLGANSIRIR